jgi:hypothetical protein
VRLPFFFLPLFTKCVEGRFSELRLDGSPKFVNDSSSIASVSALCNTAAGLRVVSPLYASRREEDGEDHPFGALAAAGGPSGSGFVGADADGG